MNKQYKLYTFIILLTLPLLIIFYIFLYFFLYYSSDKFFIEDKVAKSIHLKYHANQEKKNFDYVFIGSSKTQNHISTNLFQKYGLRVYNYGRPNMYLIDFPFAVNQALQYNPKHIVLSIDIEEVSGIKQNIIKVKFPTDIDYKMINQLNESHLLKFNSFNKYLSSVIRLKDLWFRYSRLKQNSRLVDKRLNVYKVDYNYIDCNISSFRGNIKRSVFVCDNGDGFIISKNFNANGFKTKKIDTIGEDNVHLRLLNSIIALIKKHNVTPIIVIQAKRYGVNYQIDRRIFNKFNTKNVIVLVNYLNNRKQYWADNHHFNYIGRYYYSKQLITELKKLRK